MTVTTRGQNPDQFFRDNTERLLKIINEGAFQLEGELVKKSPTGVSSQLKGGWSVQRATPSRPVATVGQSVSYFLPVEMGRRPGKGISQDGQESVALWAQRVLELDNSTVGGEADQFARYLSIKYYRFGRPASGFAGLAKPGSVPTGDPGDEIQPITGGLIFNELRRIRDALERV